MVTDAQVRRLMGYHQQGKPLALAAAKADMDEKTARKYVDAGKLPSQMKVQHTWRTREDPFAEVWDWVRAQLGINEGLEAKTLFQELQRRYPGQFQDGQLRTLQRRVKVWRATEGPAKEIYFPQVHRPGELAQSDFTGDIFKSCGWNKEKSVSFDIPNIKTPQPREKGHAPWKSIRYPRSRT